MIEIIDGREMPPWTTIWTKASTTKEWLGNDEDIYQVSGDSGDSEAGIRKPALKSLERKREEDPPRQN
jgi:hypothetical protein